MMSCKAAAVIAALAAIASGCAPSRDAFRAQAVLATAQTVPMPNANDAADDPAIWVNPKDPARSLIIGTNKQDGLGVYALDGAQVHYHSFGRPNNVDVRRGFPLAGGVVDIVATEDRSINGIRVFTINGESGELTEVSAGILSVGMDVYGSGLYQSAQDGAFYFFVGSKTGEVRQFLLRGNDEGRVEAEMVRTLKLATQVEGIVADDELGYLFVGEEGRGVWRFGAEPTDAPEGRLISAIGRDQPLRRADVEGLAIYKSSASEGYLIASSQGSNEYVIFQRGEPHGYVGTFRIAAGYGIDAVEETDGIDVTSLSLGPEFPGGVFVAQDGRNPRGNQNFKIVPWHRIAEAFNPPLASSGR